MIEKDFEDFLVFLVSKIPVKIAMERKKLKTDGHISDDSDRVIISSDFANEVIRRPERLREMFRCRAATLEYILLKVLDGLIIRGRYSDIDQLLRNKSVVDMFTDNHQLCGDFVRHVIRFDTGRDKIKICENLMSHEVIQNYMLQNPFECMGFFVKGEKYQSHGVNFIVYSQDNSLPDILFISGEGAVYDDPMIYGSDMIFVLPKSSEDIHDIKIHFLHRHGCENQAIEKYLGFPSTLGEVLDNGTVDIGALKLFAKILSIVGDPSRDVENAQVFQPKFRFACDQITKKLVLMEQVQKPRSLSVWSFLIPLPKGL